MFGFLSSTLRAIMRFLLVLVLIAGLALVAFVVHQGSQPMQRTEAHGMIYWQFIGERVSAIRALPAKCQQLHFSGYLIAVPVYPALYTAVGLWPESTLARHTQPHPAIPREVSLADAPSTWWSLVETISWEAWVTMHVPQVMPECNLPPPQPGKLTR